MVQIQTNQAQKNNKLHRRNKEPKRQHSFSRKINAKKQHTTQDGTHSSSPATEPLAPLSYWLVQEALTAYSPHVPIGYEGKQRAWNRIIKQSSGNCHGGSMLKPFLQSRRYKVVSFFLYRKANESSRTKGSKGGGLGWGQGYLTRVREICPRVSLELEQKMWGGVLILQLRKPLSPSMPSILSSLNHPKKKNNRKKR